MESRSVQIREDLCVRVDGYFRGDIGLNDSDLVFTINTSSLCLKIKPFTNNCGIKAISDVYGDMSFFPWVESFLFHVCRAAMFVGSDFVEGHTFLNLKKIPDLIVSEVVWNPNYTWDSGWDHKIVLFYKHLNYYKGTMNPWPDWKASNV